MGVNYNHIILYGFRFPYDEYEHQKFEDYRLRDSTEGDIVAIGDGRAGEYLFVGVLQFCSDDGRHGRASIPVTEPTEPTTKQATTLGQTLVELELSTDEDPTHYVFTHFH